MRKESSKKRKQCKQEDNHCQEINGHNSRLADKLNIKCLHLLMTVFVVRLSVYIAWTLFPDVCYFFFTWFFFCFTLKSQVSSENNYCLLSILLCFCLVLRILCFNSFSIANIYKQTIYFHLIDYCFIFYFFCNVSRMTHRVFRMWRVCVTEWKFIIVCHCYYLKQQSCVLTKQLTTVVEHVWRI